MSCRSVGFERLTGIVEGFLNEAIETITVSDIKMLILQLFKERINKANV